MRRYARALDTVNAEPLPPHIRPMDSSAPTCPARVATAGREVDELVRVNGQWLIPVRDVAPKDRTAAEVQYSSRNNRHSANPVCQTQQRLEQLERLERGKQPDALIEQVREIDPAREIDNQSARRGDFRVKG